MNTELFIEGYRLDLTAEISALLNFAIDDIKDFSARSTTWSRTIVLPGTANNNRQFGHIFQVGQSNNYDGSQPNVGFNFNAAKAAPVILFQDQIQTFKGVLRLLQINISDGFQGRVEYEVSIFGNLVGLNSALSGSLLETLDFSAYNHIYNDANIVNSWDNPGGSGYYYPLIDYGTYSTDKHNWDIKTFRPGLYAREYIDKMFTAAGYRWQSALFDTPRFKSIIVPHGKKIMTTNQSTIFAANDSTSYYGTVPVVDIISNPTESGTPVRWLSTSGSGFTSQDPPNNTIFKYNGTVTTNVVLTIDIKGHFTTSPSDTFHLGQLVIYLYKNTPNAFTPSWSGVSNFSPYEFGLNQTTNISLAPGDTIQFGIAQNFFNTLTDVWVDSASFSVKAAAGTIAVPIQIGDNVILNDQIPQNIRQVDFLVGIVKLFNLYVYEDKNDEHLIYITPYIDFYSKNFSNAVDWTLKLNRNKVTKVKPMSELNAKIYKFKFKSDSDYFNDLYRKRYNEGYGDRIYDSQFEFTQQTSEFEILFSGTPLVGYGGEDKVYSTIFKRTGSDSAPTEENVDSNIRLLLTKKVTGVNFWQIKNGATALNTLTRYGYAGHLDDPDIPTNDLNFGAPKELFFILSAGNMSNNQFNVYWSNYMREITDKDSKLVTANFYLTARDILNLDFSKYIYVDGVAFRLNAIKDYDASNPNDCVVELLKVNAASYTESSSNNGPPDGCYLLWTDDNTLDWTDSDALLYGDCATNPGDGGPPPVVYKLDWSWSNGITSVFGSFVRFRIYIDGVVSVYEKTSNSGSFNLTAGQTIKVEITSAHGTREIFISNDVDGVIFDQITGTINPFNHTFTVDANKNYTVTGTIS